MVNTQIYSQKDVLYRKSTEADVGVCGNCKYFIAGRGKRSKGKCVLVKGRIDLGYICNLWSEKEE